VTVYNFPQQLRYGKKCNTVR